MWGIHPLAFGFLQPALLGWMAAAAIPVLIHLWSRRRHRETEWAAMEFLLAAYRPRRLRLFLQELLLLLARVALIVLLVLAAAEPVWRGLPAGSPPTFRTHRIFVIDASLSMSAEEGGTTRFEAAKAAVARQVESAAPGDAFSAILAAGVPDLALAGPIFDRRAFRRELQRLQPTDGRADWAAALAQCRELIATSRQEASRPVPAEVLLVTDLQRASWPAAAGTAVANATVTLQREARLLAETARLAVLSVSSGEWQGNAAVTDLELESGGMTVGEEAAWRAVLRRYGPELVTPVSVQWFLDGKLVRESILPWNGERRREAMLSYRFDSPGEHEVEVRIAPDALKGDDARRFVVPVRPAVQVLCVDGRPSNVPFQGAADYLRLALQPSEEEGFRRVAVETVNEAAFDETDLLPFDAVFFCDVAEFTESEAARLSAFLNRGGAAFFLGERVRAENYNRVLAAGQGGRGRISPARLGPVIRRDAASNDPLGYRHPLLRVFQGRESAGLLTTPVRAYFRLEKIPDANAETALALDNGDPLIVTETVAAGRVIVTATTADATWTAFPTWTDYVPMVQEMLEYLLEPTRARRNVTVGDTIGEVRDLKNLSGSIDVEIVTPDGQRIRRGAAVEKAMLRWSFDGTARAGFYRADLRPSGVAEGGLPTGFAVNPPAEESDPAGWLPEEFPDRVLPGVPVEMWSGTDRGPAAGETVAGYNPGAQWLLQLALLLLVLEMMLAVRSG